MLRLAAGTAVFAGFAANAQPQRPLDAVAPEPVPAPPATALKFTPPDESTIPNSPLGGMIRFGRDVFVDTQRYAKKYVGNGLSCANCHLDAGRRAGSGPLWAAYVAYPAFRTKNEQVNTFEQRFEGCFRFSMNGRMPPADDDIVVGLKTGAVYAFPPLWGRASFNAGAGMHRVPTAAAFIKANMPLGQGGTLTDQQAWDVAAFMNSHPRP